MDEVIESGVHRYNENEKNYVVPDADVQKRLSAWQGMKLGFMVHWGVYSQWGIVESWSLSDDDAPWSRKDVAFGSAELKQRYGELHKTFNPVQFDPDEWAKAAFDGGFRYFVFTTKHHDGFCMYDSKYSDYKITSPQCPYHSNEYADVTRHLFDAFRRKGMPAAAYFSKPDWSSEYYWEPGKPVRKPSRGPTYLPADDMGKWDKFKAYTHNQIDELMSGYGPVEVLWLDGGWVNPRSDGQDIDMAAIAENARKKQPGLIIVDRTVGGPYENYITPEQTIPRTPVLIPWEANITMGTSFSYRNDDEYKSERQLIHLLIDVVAKGGNLVLNAGGQPNGKLPAPAVARMAAIGKWLKGFGEAIYETKPVAPYVTGNIGFTEKGACTYALRMLAEGETCDRLVFPYSKPVKSVTMLRRGLPLKFAHQNGTLYVEIPALECEDKIAFAVKVE